MALQEYKKKRSFSKTPEPVGGRSNGSELHFVVQKHDATRLHYDFRLEMGGVLKSWAVPKGPSTDPAVKRLAMMVEDHPYDYRNFEGIIPEGNYGAGTVIVWDEGTYEPIEPLDGKKAQEKYLLKELRSGSVKVILHGKKLKGEFALVKTKGMEENAWLLIKHRDKYARETDITKKDKSVISGKTIAKMEKTPEKIYGKKTIKPGTTEKDKATAAKAIKKATAPVKKTAKKTVQKKSPDLNGAPKAAFPKTVSPMLARLVDKPFDAPGWQYEIKWDGYRAIARMNKKEHELISRNNKSFNEKFYPVYKAIQQWGIDAVVDGEVCVLNEKGMANFGSLQNWRSEADGDLIYYVFDILWLNGHDLQDLELQQRRDILRELIPADGIIRMSENFDTSATEFLAAAAEMGLEGIIAKKADSVYRQGQRGDEWLKIKSNKRHEVVIGGYTKNTGSGKLFSSLLVGVYEKSKLIYTGKIGTGFTEAMQKEMMTQFKPLIIKTPPFESEPDINKPSRFRPNPPHAAAVWLKPQLVCEVSYTEMTSDGVMRHPSFEGMREDKPAKNVQAETAAETTDIVPPKKAAEKIARANKQQASTKKLLVPVKDSGRKTLLNPTDETQVRKINGIELKFSNLDKIYWPKEKYTKRDMLNYYYQIAPFILPYLKGRPQSLNRFPNGIDGESFYQKDVKGKAPEWVETFPYTSEGEKKEFMVATDDASLLYMANLGCIEMNPWSSTTKNPENPDWCILDLDPDTNTFDQVIETALVIKDVLHDLGVEGFPKTSGSTGIHIYIPLKAKYTYDESQLFARLIAGIAQQTLPKFTSIERPTAKRKGKIYIDFLQNRNQATLAAPYSLRPKPGATVSMPLHWEEVKKGLKMKDFTIENALARVRENGDIFKGVLGKGANIKQALKKMEAKE